VDFLQGVRDALGVPVTINSAHRCAAHNRAVGGASNSFHLQGRAADFTAAGRTPEAMAIAAEGVRAPGIIRYTGRRNFVHIDTRPGRYWATDHSGTIRTVSTFGWRPPAPPPHGQEIIQTLYRVTTQRDPLNVRATPNGSGRVLGQFPRGSLVTADRRSGDWLHVTDGRLTGWASALHLTDAVVQAIDRLVSQRVIDSPHYWRERYRDLDHLDRLLINLSVLTLTPGISAASLEEAIRILVGAGAMDPPGAYWITNHGQVRHLDTLIKRAAGMVAGR